MILQGFARIIASQKRALPTGPVASRSNVTKEDKKRGVRITGQFRSRDSMVYDFICDNIRITISVCSSKPDDNEFSAEAVARQVPNAPPMHGVGPSRGDAITALAESWTSKNGAVGVPWLDWPAIREALAAVRAI